MDGSRAFSSQRSSNSSRSDCSITLPSLIRNASFLSAPGGAFGFRKWVIVVVAVAVVGLALFAFRSVRNVVVIGVCSVVVACSLGLGALLFTSRNAPSPWTYYPLKFMWLAIVVLVVLLVGVVAAAVVRAVAPTGWRLAGFGLLAAFSGRRARVAAVGTFLSLDEPGAAHPLRPGPRHG